MERPACGTRPLLPPLPPRRILELVRERFAALRGTGEPPRLLLDVRPYGDTSEQFDGAIELELSSAPVNHRTFLCGGMVANEGDEGRSMVRAWLIGEPSPLDAAAAACRDAGAWLRPLLVSARLVDDSLRPAGLVWPAALACLTPGAHRTTRLGGVDFRIPETEIPPPGALPAAVAWMLSIGFRMNDAPASGPLPEMFDRPVGSEFAPDRLFVIENVVEKSIVLVDRLIEGLPPDKPSKPKDETAGKRPTVPRKRGRPSMEGLDRVAKAVFWYDQALKSHDEDLRRALAGGDDSPAAVYAALTEYPLELDRKSVDRKHLALFPEKAGEKVAVWSFRDYAIDIDKSSFVRYMGEHKKRTRGQAAAMPGRTVAAEKVEAGKKTTAATMRQQALERADKSLFKVAQDMADESRWVALTKAMTKAGVDDDVAKELLASRDDAALTAAGKRIADLMA